MTRHQAFEQAIHWLRVARYHCKKGNIGYYHACMGNVRNYRDVAANKLRGKSQYSYKYKMKKVMDAPDENN